MAVITMVVGAVAFLAYEFGVRRGRGGASAPVRSLSRIVAALVGFLLWPFIAAVRYYLRRRDIRRAARLVQPLAIECAGPLKDVVPVPERIIVKDIFGGVQVKLVVFADHIVPEVHLSDAVLIERLGGDVLPLASVEFPAFDVLRMTKLVHDVTKQVKELLASLGYVQQENVMPEPAAEAESESTRDPALQPDRVVIKDICKGVQVRFGLFADEVLPVMHLSDRKLKDKLGGEVLPLPAIKMSKFDLCTLTDIVLSVTEQVSDLLVSFDATASISTHDVQSRRFRRKELAVQPVASAVQVQPLAAAEVAPVEELEVEFDNNEKEVKGKLIGSGVDKRTLNDAIEGTKVIDSFFVDVQLRTGQIARRWGVDLERALERSLAVIGDKVVVKHNGKLGRKNSYNVVKLG